MIILVADDGPMSRELIRELAGRIRPTGRKVRSPADLLVSHHSLTYTLSALQRLEQATMWRKRQFMVYSKLETESSMALPTDCGRVTSKLVAMPRPSTTGRSRFMSQVLANDSARQQNLLESACRYIFM
jgi:hypothetical protein